MAKKIIDMVKEKKAAIAENSDAAEDLGKLAAAAINDGIKSSAWAKYMFQFVEKDPNDPTKPLDPAQLSRLLAEDGTSTNPDLIRKRAYMLGNGVCGAGSPDTGGLDRFVDSIDDGLGGVLCNTAG